MASIVELGTLEGDATKPILRASADGREFRVDSEEFKKIKARLVPSQQQQRVPGRGALPPQ